MVRAVIIMALTDSISSDVESYLEVQSALYIANIANIAAALKTAREETRASPTYEEIKQYLNNDYRRGLL